MHSGHEGVNTVTTQHPGWQWRLNANVCLGRWCQAGWIRALIRLTPDSGRPCIPTVEFHSGRVLPTFCRHVLVVSFQFSADQSAAQCALASPHPATRGPSSRLFSFCRSPPRPGCPDELHRQTQLRRGGSGSLHSLVHRDRKKNKINGKE